MRHCVQVSLLKIARDMAGGVSLLARELQVAATNLDQMLQERDPVPTWLFLKAVDYVNDVQGNKILAPGALLAEDQSALDLSLDREPGPALDY
jgi:hypothetical protein